MFVILLFALKAFAQDPATGFPPYGSFQDGRFDAVNRQNLNVNFAIPIVSSPGRGTDFRFAIIYDSLFWTRPTGTAWSSVTDGSGTATWGWNKDFPIGEVSFKTATSAIKCFPPGEPWYWGTKITYSNYAYYDPSGTKHPFDITRVWLSCDDSWAAGAMTGHATDKSGYHLDATAATAPIVRSAAGIKIVRNSTNGTHTLTDTNGNYISKIVVSSTETHWKDTLGRITLKIIKPSSTTIEYHALDVSGNYQITTMALQSFNLKTNFGCSGVSEYSGTVYLPIELSLPNDRSYSFTYETTPGFPNKKTGRLLRVTLPTGGYYEYVYPAYPNNGIDCGSATVTNLTRVINDGISSVTWTFSRTQGGSNWTTTVTAPQPPYDSAANQSTFTFNSSGQLSTQQIYQGSVASGTLLRRIDTGWAANGTPSITTVTLSDTNQQSQTFTTFDDYGNLGQLKEYAWGTGAPGSLVRTTKLWYLSTQAYTNLNIRNRLIQRIVYEGGELGPVKSRTDITYDGTSFTECPSGVAHHDDTAYACSFTTRGNPTSVTNYTDPVTPGGGITRSFYYDSLGNLRQADVSCCQQKQWSFSAATQYAYPNSVTDGPPTGPQLTTTFAYNFHTGLLTSVTDPNLKITSFAYDILKRLTTVTRPDNSQITTTYDDVNRTITAEIPIQGTDRVRRRTYFDPLGRRFKECILDGADAIVSCTETQYDTVGRGYRVSNPYTVTPQYWTETRFDGMGRPTMVIPPDGTPTSNRTVYTYSDNTVTITDPTGKQQKTETDALGRPIKVYEPDVDNGNQLTQLTTNTYNVLDLLTQATQGVQTRTYVYDSLGRLTSVKTPETNNETTPTLYQYNSFDLVTQRTDPKGIITTYTHDTLNRLTQVNYSDGTPPVTYTYGTDPNSNNNGRLVTMTDGTGSESYTYDLRAQITRLDKVIDGITYAIQYQYNLAGAITQITNPSGRAVQQFYDSIGRLVQIANGGNSYASGFSYNPAGQVTGFLYGNQVSASVGYSPERLLLQSLNYTKQGESQPFFSLTYGYFQNGGNNGQITSITDNVDSTRSLTYTYDALARLKVAFAGPEASPRWKLDWDYDRYGNRKNQNVRVSPPPPDIPPGAPQLAINPATNRITDAGFSYSEGGSPARGNLTNDGLNSYTYDAENRVKTMNGTGATYFHDGTGRRVKKVAGATTTRYVFSGTKVIAEYENGAVPLAPTREYVYLGSQLLVTIEGTSTKYHHPDHLSERVSTDQSGNPVHTYGHYPFGETWYETGTPDKWSFTTYERDGESTLDYAMFRYDSSRLGRFMTPDAIAGSVHDPQSLNRYSYSRNDPVNITDPSGLLMLPAICIFDPLDAACGGGHAGGSWVITWELGWFEGIPGVEGYLVPPGWYLFSAWIQEVFVGPRLPDKVRDQIDKALEEVKELLKKEKCKNLFGGKGLETLQGTDYRALNLGKPTVDSEGAVRVEGARTLSSTLVVVNLQGPFFDPVQFVPGARTNPVQFGRDLGVDPNQVPSLILLHELGHQLSEITGFKPDANNSELNKSQSEKILENCLK